MYIYRLCGNNVQDAKMFFFLKTDLMFNEFFGNVVKPRCAAPKIKLVQKGEEDILHSKY